MLHGLHVNCTRFLTHLAWHASRGMHDRLASYDGYDCAHSIRGAHLVRDCAAVAEPEHQ